MDHEADDIELDEDAPVVLTDGKIPCAHCGQPTHVDGKSPDFPLCDTCEG